MLVMQVLTEIAVDIDKIIITTKYFVLISLFICQVVKEQLYEIKILIGWKLPPNIYMSCFFFYYELKKLKKTIFFKIIFQTNEEVFSA